MMKSVVKYYNLLIDYLFFKEFRAKDQKLFDKDVISIITKINVTRIVPFGLIVFLISLVFFINDILTVKDTNDYWIVVLTELVISLFSLGYVFLSVNLINKRGVKSSTLYWFNLSFWVILVLLVDIIQIFNAINYSIVETPPIYYLMIAVIPAFRTRTFTVLSILLLLPPSIILMNGIVPYSTQSFHDLVGYFLFSIVCSFILFHNIYRQIAIRKRLEKANQKLDVISKIDPLTGVYNRIGMDEEIQKLWNKTGVTISVMIGDIDYFKKFNDIYGHYHGDRCLEIIGQTFYKTFHIHEGFIARLGGEEFIVTLVNKSKSEIIALVKELQGEVARIHMDSEDGRAFYNVTLSIGITNPSKIDNRDWKSFYLEADTALYEAKNLGRNCFVFSNEQKEQVV